MAPRHPDRVLVVDDDPTGLEVAAWNLRKAGHQVDTATDGAEGLERFDPARHALVLTDLRMPRMDGLELIRRIKATAPELPVIVITAHGGVDSAVEAMRAGAWDFIEKPFSRERLLVTVDHVLDRLQLVAENRRLKDQRVERPIELHSKAMHEVIQLADMVAASSSPVLIRGESGVGKELVARRLHARSPRADGPFVAVNCAALPGELLESELFGHTKGAFSGASRSRKGRFRRADAGTLFLDEVSEMSPRLQAKLLRVLQEGMVDIVGSDEPVKVDVRVVAATNQPLEERIADGRFREDLYYRLNVVEIQVPPLRERTEDIAPLVRRFVAELSAGRELAIPPGVIRELERRSWPGNVRELRNACERMVLLCPGRELRAKDLPPARHRPAGAWLDQLPGDISLVDIEAQVVEHALRRCGWNLSEAARRLGVPRHVLAYRVQKHGIRKDAEA